MRTLPLALVVMSLLATGCGAVEQAVREERGEPSPAATSSASDPASIFKPLPEGYAYAEPGAGSDMVTGMFNEISGFAFGSAGPRVEPRSVTKDGEAAAVVFVSTLEEAERSNVPGTEERQREHVLSYLRQVSEGPETMTLSGETVYYADTNEPGLDKVVFWSVRTGLVVQIRGTEREPVIDVATVLIAANA